VIQKLHHPILNKKQMQGMGRNLLLYLFIRKVIKQTIVIIQEYYL